MYQYQKKKIAAESGSKNKMAASSIAASAWHQWRMKSGNGEQQAAKNNGSYVSQRKSSTYHRVTRHQRRSGSMALKIHRRSVMA